MTPPRRPKGAKTGPFSPAAPAMPPPAPAEGAFRDWGHLVDLPLSEVLRRLLPCLRSLFAFAATCRPWRRLLRASASDLVLPRLPPLLLCAASRVVPFSSLVVAQPLSYHLPSDATLLSASRGHLILRRRGPFGCLLLADALIGAEGRAVPLPSPHFAYHYAALSPSHLLLFHSKYSFFSLPFPNPNPHADLGWTQHSLPRAASFVTGVLEFRGRVLGITDRAQLLEFHIGANPPNQATRMLPAIGLPDATMFDRWHFGPRLVAAGDRLLLVLFMLGPKLGAVTGMARRVQKVVVYGLDMAQMRWEEVENIGAYSLFVDCAGRSAVACVDAENCDVKENQLYVAAPGCRTWRAFPPGWEVPPGGDGLFSSQAMACLPWPSQIWVYPRLFF